ncbi:MAG: mono/diheme cytochrome c family protein [Verrucomicrobiales bacterium]|jgi:mono/diheme cytochrome c family protein
MMRIRLTSLALLLSPALLLSAEQPPVNYDEHIKPIFRQHCLKCHGEDKHKADLNLQSYATAMKGGSGGSALVAGRAAQSLLFQAINNPDDDARMPPNKRPIPNEQITTIQRWIESGLREAAGGESLATARDTSFQPSADIGAKPAVPAMPENLPDVTLPETLRPLPALALDTSPWAPLVAVSGQGHVRLIHAQTQEELGRLPFPEGVPHVIRFSRDGSLLMVAGGQPVQSGKVILFDIKSGKRLAAIGDEIDVVLAADLSPDQKLLALGGSGKVVKVYSTADGTLQYKIEKHTDWITATAFSPDGKHLATADRAGGLHLWDASGGGIILSLSAHKASIRALDWRPDNKFLVSAAEDGHIIWWDVADGWPAIDRSNAHPPLRPAGSYGTIPNGVLAARFDHNGMLSTTGRDQVVQLWDTQGNSLKKFKLDSGLPISIAFSHCGDVLVGGDSLGQVQFWKID